MPATPTDVAVYVKNATRASIVTAIDDCAGLRLTLIERAPEDLDIYASAETRLMLQSAADGFLCVWLRYCGVWPDDVALARFLVERLQCVARCDPGAHVPDAPAQASVFLEIGADGERLIVWQ